MKIVALRRKQTGGYLVISRNRRDGLPKMTVGMSVAPVDPNAARHQQQLRLYASDVQAQINPTTPGQIPKKPITSGNFGGSGGSLGPREEGWQRSQRFNEMAGNNFVSGGSGWNDFANGNASRKRTGTGAGEIDGKPAAGNVVAQAKLEFPNNASNAQKQSIAYDFAASFQEYARDALRTLGIGRRAA